MFRKIKRTPATDVLFKGLSSSFGLAFPEVGKLKHNILPGREFGLCALQLLIALQKQDSSVAIRELEILASFPEPEMRRVIGVVLSLMRERDRTFLQGLQCELENTLIPLAA
jgi:hypothetical protein